MRKSSFLFGIAAGLLVNSAASTPAWGGSVLYSMKSNVIVTSGLAVSAEYVFTSGPLSEVTIVATSLLGVTSQVNGTAIDFDFVETPVGFFWLEFVFLGPPSLANVSSANTVDGTGYIEVVSFTAVPEPTSLVLLGTGVVLGPIACAWRRRKQGRERRFPAKQIL